MDNSEDLVRGLYSVGCAIIAAVLGACVLVGVLIGAALF